MGLSSVDAGSWAPFDAEAFGPFLVGADSTAASEDFDALALAPSSVEPGFCAARPAAFAADAFGPFPVEADSAVGVWAAFDAGALWLSLAAVGFVAAVFEACAAGFATGVFDGCAPGFAAGACAAAFAGGAFGACADFAAGVFCAFAPPVFAAEVFGA
ncbi:hypothetical protein D7Y04_32600 [Corallococcus sp. AB038B]|nr:hypothetical protein D7Y04_32600 [Corallococcus sp. AB038B]